MTVSFSRYFGIKLESLLDSSLEVSLGWAGMQIRRCGRFGIRARDLRSIPGCTQTRTCSRAFDRKIGGAR